jgi:hypothetical protein
MMKKYFSSNVDRDFYNTTLSLKPDSDKFIFSAYRPGPQNDASVSGMWNNAIRPDTQNMKRNFYSTKFVTLKSLKNGGSPTFLESSNGAGIPIHSEGNQASLGASRATGQKDFANPLDLQKLNLDLGELKH